MLLLRQSPSSSILQLRAAGTRPIIRSSHVASPASIGTRGSMTEKYVAGAVFQAMAWNDQGAIFNVCIESPQAFAKGSTAKLFLGRTATPGIPTLLALKVFLHTVGDQELHKIQALHRELAHAKAQR